MSLLDSCSFLPLLVVLGQATVSSPLRLDMVISGGRLDQRFFFLWRSREGMPLSFRDVLPSPFTFSSSPELSSSHLSSSNAMTVEVCHCMNH